MPATGSQKYAYMSYTLLGVWGTTHSSMHIHDIETIGLKRQATATLWLGNSTDTQQCTLDEYCKPPKGAKSSFSNEI
jgi:hypothetical protein